MEIQEQALHFCEYVKTLTGIHSTLLDIPAANFCAAPFRCGCALKNGVCDAYQTHLYGCYESERWGGKFIYYCPRGLVFIATALRRPGQALEYCMVTGPFIMSNSEEDLFEDTLLQPDPAEQIPRISTSRARSLNETVHAICCYLTGIPATPDVDSGRQAEILQMMYDLNSQPAAGYPMELERKLRQQIRVGDKEGSQKLLNELLSQMYLVNGTDLSVFKIRVRELITLMSRAAIDGGADVNEVFGLCYRGEQELDQCRDFEMLNMWLGAMLHKFIRFVFDFTDIKHQNVLRKTSIYIKEHLAEKLTLEQVTDQVYLSRSHFCRILKEELGCTFTEYVNHLRIEQSKIYLRERSMPLIEIAHAVGFDDQSYFTRIFKRYVGVSPGKFRNMRD
ncbi:MAG: AraC family transcriptional regulator [Butyricicoccus sp.]|nr:AraC family transcriptional regulator [Butyricicoccus sp.]